MLCRRLPGGAVARPPASDRDLARLKKRAVVVIVSRIAMRKGAEAWPPTCAGAGVDIDFDGDVDEENRFYYDGG